MNASERPGLRRRHVDRGHWCGRLPALLIPILLLAVITLSAVAAEIPVFGPKIYQGTGKAVLDRRTFEVAAGGPSVLRLRNSGVWAALIVLNGRIVLRPADFVDPPVHAGNPGDPWSSLWDQIRRDWRAGTPVPTVPLIETPVTLRTGTNELVVGFVSRSGTSFSVEIVRAAVDTTSPVITAAVSPPPNASGWNKTDATVTFTCTDADSGIATCPPPVTVSTEGAAQIVSGTAVDKAGNTAVATATVSLDKTLPSLSASAAPGPNARERNDTSIIVHSLRRHHGMP